MKARIAWLPGDGIGPEVLREARRVLEVIASEHSHEFQFVEADIGGVAIERHGEPLPRTGAAHDRGASRCKINGEASADAG